MSGNAYTKNIGAFLNHVLGFVQTSQTAGATSEINGLAIDRNAQALTNLNAPNLLKTYHSAVAMFGGRATLASGNTLSVIGNFQHSDSTTTGFTDVGTALSTTKVLDAAGGALTAQAWKAKMPIILSEAKQVIRVQATPVFSATGTDTCEILCLVVFGGAQENPAQLAIGPNG